MFLFNFQTYKSSKLNFSSLLLFIVAYFLLTFVFIFSVNTVYGYSPSFSWDANYESDIAGYRVFYREMGQQYDFENPDWEGAETSCTLQDLDDDTKYYFVARAFNTDGLESENSVELSNVIPSATGSAAESGSGGGGCFIATGSFRTIMEPHAALLRQFRDRFLLTHASGKTLVDLYYIYSPPFAKLISSNDSLRTIVRWSLLPLIGVSWMLLHLGVLSTIMVFILVGSVVWLGVRIMKFRHLTTDG